MMRGPAPTLGLVLGLALLAPGCPYVSRAEIEAQLELRDDDGDGVSVADGACDDLDATVFPGADEVPYDNVDNDCVDGDLRDVDGDGHDGCLLQGGSCVEGEAPDCDDEDAARFPGAQDEPYDGVDSDCKGNHDYDLDSDGFTAADADEGELAAYETASGLSAQRGDCVDTNLTVYPGAAGDVPYDGVDTDCDGANDFDADGDGFVAPEDDSALALAALERYLEGLGDTLPDASELDCDDADPDVNPGEDEVWYDGLDADCDGADDYDQDGDGFELSEDCSDDPTADPDAARISPDSVESLSTEADDDCFNDDDSRWGGADSEWTNPRSVRVVHAGDRFVLGGVLDGYESPFASVPDANAVGIFNFDVAGLPAPLTDERLFLFPTNDIDALSLYAVGSDVDVSWVEPFESTVVSRLYRYGLAGVGPGQALLGPEVALSNGVLDASVVDLDDTWAWACGPDQLLAVELTGKTVTTAVTPVPGEPLTCFQEAAPNVATVCVASGCQTFEAAAGTLTSVPGRTGALISEAHRSDGVWTFIDDGQLVVEGASVPSEAADHASFVADDGQVYGLLQGPGGLELLHGPDGGPFERIALTPDVTGAVVEVSLAVSDERLFGAVRTDADEVRWATWIR